MKNSRLISRPSFATPSASITAHKEPCFVSSFEIDFATLEGPILRAPGGVAKLTHFENWQTPRRCLPSAGHASSPSSVGPAPRKMVRAQVCYAMERNRGNPVLAVLPTLRRRNSKWNFSKGVIHRLWLTTYLKIKSGLPLRFELAPRIRGRGHSLHLRAGRTHHLMFLTVCCL
jgi:hypothetical protein